MKKILAVASATLMLSSVAGVATAHHKDGHDANTHGMCTAYFSGSENGQAHKRDNGNAFDVFEDGIGDRDGDDDVDAYDVADVLQRHDRRLRQPGQGNDPSCGDSGLRLGCTNQCTALRGPGGWHHPR